MAAATSPGLPSPGDRIAGKYDVVRVIGEGGMGIVYEVMHARLQQRAAIKMLQPRVQAMPDVVARFEREARAACRFQSRHSVRITDVDHDERGRAYMVMEYLDGHDLAFELHARGRLPAEEAVDVVLQACAAMAEAHTNGVVHRDLKPSNLFLVKEGGESMVKVLDFGISKLAGEGEAHITSTFATMGTPLYMSPEQVRSAKNVDARTDIWSLGVILFECLTGQRPFQGTTTAAAAAIVADEPPLLRSLLPDAPEDLERIVSRALAKKPEGRFQDVRGLALALSAFAGNPGVMRAIDATMISPGAASSLRPARPSSTPSFVHAETMAQETPPQYPSARGGSPKLPAGAPTLAAPVVGEHTPSTEASWSSPRASSMGKGKLTAIALCAFTLAAVGAFGFTRVRSGHVTVSPPPSAASTGTVTPSTPASSPPAASLPGVAPSAPLPAPAASTPSPPPPPAGRPRSRPSPRPAPSAAPAAQPTPTPAATNPLHL